MCSILFGSFGDCIHIPVVSPPCVFKIVIVVFIVTGFDCGSVVLLAEMIKTHGFLYSRTVPSPDAWILRGTIPVGLFGCAHAWYHCTLYPAIPAQHCFCMVFSKIIIHESSRPGNPCGLPGLVFQGLSATAPSETLNFLFPLAPGNRKLNDFV